MNRSPALRGSLVVVTFVVLLACSLVGLVEAQVRPQPLSPGNPSDDCGCRRQDDPVTVSSGMLDPFLPKIPNLELGFLYSFGKNVQTGRFTADYTRPFSLGPDSVLFGEAHTEWWDFGKRPDVSLATPPEYWVTTTSPTSNRVDLSFGGGYRTMLGANTFLGVNGFYDTSRLYNRWYSSSGVGLEFAAMTGEDDAVDLNFNWYGNLFNRDVLVNAFRNNGGNFDLEAGYSHALFNHALDLRFKFAGYQFSVGNPVYGWRTGADLTTKDGTFTLRYEYGRDQINGEYNTVGAFVNVGFQLDDLLRGENPFKAPEPAFRSPRNLRRLLGLPVKRNWHQPEAVVMAKTAFTHCTNLQGSLFLTSGIDNSQVITPSPSFADPSVSGGDTVYVTFCWCRLKNYQGAQISMQLQINDNWLTNNPLTFAPASETGCSTQSISVFSNSGTLMAGQVILRNSTPGQTTFPLEFGAGGGVSFSVTH
jgi:hypothetical protein